MEDRSPRLVETASKKVRRVTSESFRSLVMRTSKRQERPSHLQSPEVATISESNFEDNMEGIYVLSLDVISIVLNFMTMSELGIISQVCKFWKMLCGHLIEGRCFRSGNQTGRRITLSKSLSWSHLKPMEEMQPSYKIVVLGSGASGKSCLIRRLLQNTYVEKYDPTIEETYSKEMMIDGQICQLSIIDTGVGEYQALTDGYILTAEGVMILYAINSRSSFDYASKMRRRILELRRKSNRPPIILIGTKLDLEEDRTVPREEGQKMANSWNPEYYRNFFELTSREAQPVILESFSEMVRQIEDSRCIKKRPRGDIKKCAIM